MTTNIDLRDEPPRPALDTARLRRVIERAVRADQSELLKVANNNGTASDAAWDRIKSSDAYKRLEANLAESEAALAEVRG